MFGFSFSILYTVIGKKAKEFSEKIAEIADSGSPEILDMEEYEKINAILRLMSELEKGEHSSREKGWIGFSEIRKKFASNIPD